MSLGVCLNLSWYQSGYDVCKIRLNNSEKYSVVVTVIQYNTENICRCQHDAIYSENPHLMTCLHTT